MYLTSIVLLLSYIWLLTQRQLRPSVLWYVIGLLLSLGIWVTTELAGFILVFILAIVLVYTWLNRQTALIPVRRLAIVGLVGSLIGLGIALTTPGNAVRRELAGITSDFGYTFEIILSSPGAPAFISLYYAPFSTIAIFLIPLAVGYSLPISARQLPIKHARQLILAIFFIAIALICLCFGLVAYSAHTPLTIHIWIVPNTIFIIALALGGYVTGLAFPLTQKSKIRPRHVRWLAGLVFGLGFIFMLWQASQAFGTQKRFAEAWDHRDREIKNALAQDPTLQAYSPFQHPYGVIQVDRAAKPLEADSLVAESPFRWELTPDPRVYPNYCIARYYNLEALVARPIP